MRDANELSILARTLAMATAPAHTATPPTRLDGDTWERLLRCAQRESMLPALHCALAAGSLTAEPGLAADLATLFDLNRQRQGVVLAQAGEVAAALNAAGIEPVLLKGIANIADGLYPEPAVRMLGDIDLLVPEETVPAGARALHGLRYRFTPLFDWDRPEDKHYPRLVRVGSPAAVELHRAITDLAWRRVLPAHEMLASTTPLPLGEATCRIPSATHRIVHAIAHTQLDDRGLWRRRPSLRALYDVVLIAERHAIDWTEVRERFAAVRLSNAPEEFVAWAAFLLGRDPASGKLGLRRPAFPPDQASRRAARLRRWRSWLAWTWARFRASPEFRLEFARMLCKKLTWLREVGTAARLMTRRSRSDTAPVHLR